MIAVVAEMLDVTKASAFENLSLTVPRHAFRILLDQRQIPRPMRTFHRVSTRREKTTSTTMLLRLTSSAAQGSAEQLPPYGAQHRQDACWEGE